MADRGADQWLYVLAGRVRLLLAEPDRGEQSTWGGKRVPRCPEHPEAPVVTRSRPNGSPALLRASRKYLTRLLRYGSYSSGISLRMTPILGPNFLRPISKRLKLCSTLSRLLLLS